MNGHSSHQMKGSQFLTLCETNNEPTFRLHQKIDKKSKEKIRKIIDGSDLSDTNIESTFRLHQKNGKKSEKKFETYFLLRFV